MVGTSTVTANTSTEFSSDVSVNHLVAKVTLNSLSVDFTATGHTSATFKPLEVFLINVPDELTMEYDGTDYTPTGLTLTNLYQGENHDWSAHASAAKRVYADYLGTGTVYEETLDDDDTYSKRYSLYTMPYAFAPTSVTYASDNTRLVIKGEYRPAGGDAAVEPMYYAVNLNNGAGDYNIKPNTHYKVTATIKGPGADNAYDAIPLYQNFTANVDYEEWTEEATTATIDNGGIQWAQTAVDYTGIQVGDLIYADGEWSRGHVYDAAEVTAHGAPIAIVFSTTTTDYDQNTGDGTNTFAHGYAMALRNVDYYAAGGVGATAGTTDRWILKSGWCATALQSTQVTDALVTTLAGIRSDRDGLKHCMIAKAYCDDANNNANFSDLYAIYTAMNFMEAQQAAPKNTIWFLPSMGQQYEWLKAAKPTVYTGSEAWTDNSTYWTQTGQANAAAGYVNDWVKAAFNNDNDLYSANFDAFRGSAGEYFWSSTERVAGYPFDLHFSTDGNLYLDGNYDKFYANIQVRAVLAYGIVTINRKKRQSRALLRKKRHARGQHQLCGSLRMLLAVHGTQG